MSPGGAAGGERVARISTIRLGPVYVYRENENMSLRCRTMIRERGENVTCLSTQLQKTHLSDQNQQWWDPDASFEGSMNAGASWYPDLNQVPASEFEPYGIPHEQHSYNHHEPVHSFEGGQHGRSHRSRKRSDQNPDLRERDFKVNSYRPVFSVPPENVSRTSKDGSYDFAESCHAFRARPDSALERAPQDISGRHSTRRKGTNRNAMNYTQEIELDDTYVSEAHQSSEFEHSSNKDATLIFYCPHVNCGYAGPDKNSLRKHLSIHGERKFSCEKCSADFHTARDLRRHQEAKHTISNAKKNYICKVPKCTRDATWPFTRKDNARQHVMHVHEIGNGRVDDFIEEVVPPFRGGHRPTNSSSTDDTVYSTLSGDSNIGYHSHEDPEGEDIIAEFTHLQEYDSDLDIGYPSTQENWQQAGLGPWDLDHESQAKPFDLNPRLQGRRRSKSEIQSRSALHLDPQAPLYYQQREGMVQDEDFQLYHHSEQSNCYDSRSPINHISQIKEESPGPGQHYRLPSTASTATKKPPKHLSNRTSQTYHPETSATTESLEAAFEKVLII
ncbi:hypothetical protein TWF103_005949 [Orbilia oligospora]|nr:hypothetical protein TWF103_005949 [Orbilia oligospora]